MARKKIETIIKEKIYPHSLNEKDKAKVWADVLAWLEAKRA